MSKNSNIVTPILLTIGNKKYNIMSVILNKDGSIYFSFPSKKHNKIRKKLIKKYSNKSYKYAKHKLRNYKRNLIDPKISFHPRDMIVHVNTNKKRRKNDNYKIYNVLEGTNKLGCYLLQVIFPINENMYDEYNKTKHKDFIMLDGDRIKTEGVLCLEYMIHSSDIYPLPDSLPYSKNRVFKQEFRFEGSNSDYTYTVFVSILPGNNNNNFFLTTINSKKKCCIYTISNLKNIIDNYQ